MGCFAEPVTTIVSRVPFTSRIPFITIAP